MLVETRGIEPRSNRGQSGGRYVRSLCFKIRGGGSRRQDTLSLASLDLGRRPKGGTVIPAVFVTLYRGPTAEAPESALLLIKQRVRNCLRQLFFRSRINEASPSSARSPRPSACCRNLSSPEDRVLRRARFRKPRASIRREPCGGPLCLFREPRRALRRCRVCHGAACLSPRQALSSPICLL